MFKTCYRCGEIKPIGDFVKNRRYKDGVSNVCRACRNAYNREQYPLHREKILKQIKIWRDKNKEQRRVYQKDYRNKNKERLKLLAKEYYKGHRTELIERNEKYYRDHRQACQARHKLWRIKNKERVREYNREYKRRHKIAS